MGPGQFVTTAGPNDPTVRPLAILALSFFFLFVICAPLSPLFDPDEGYYPATAAETIKSGAFWDLRFNGAPRWDKPVLSYALIEAAFQVLGTSAAAARVPSALEGAALIAVIGALVARLAGRRAGIIGAIVVGTTLGVSIFSRIAHPEIAVVLSIVTTELLLCAWLTTTDRRARRLVAVAAGVSVGYGILAKGPVAVVLPGLALLSTLPFIEIDRPPFVAALGDAALATATAAALACPWFVAMVVRHGETFLDVAVWQQNVARYASATYGHRMNAFALVLPTLLGLLPWTAVLPGAMRRARRRARNSREILRNGMLASSISALAFYSLSSSKLPSYAFVCIPPLAIVIGLALDEDWASPRAMERSARRTASLLGFGAAALIVGSVASDYFLTSRRLFGAIHPLSDHVAALLEPVTLPLALMLALGAFLVIAARSPERRLTIVAGVGALVPIVVLVMARPVLAEMYPWKTFGAAIAERPAPAWLLGRRAPSLIFYAGQPVASATRDALEHEIGATHEGWIALTREDWSQLSADGGLKGIKEERQEGRKETRVVSQCGRMTLVWFETVPRTETR